MVELTDRERLISTVMFSLLNPQLEHVDFDFRMNFLTGLLTLKGIQISDDELVDLVNALNADNQDYISKAIGILGKHGSKLKGLKLR